MWWFKYRISERDSKGFTYLISEVDSRRLRYLIREHDNRNLRYLISKPDSRCSTDPVKQPQNANLNINNIKGQLNKNNVNMIEKIQRYALLVNCKLM